MQRRLLLVSIAVLASLLAALALATVLSAHASPTRALLVHAPPARADATTFAETQSESSTAFPGEVQDVTPLGAPCGGGEQLSPWVLCLHGTVSLIHASGQDELLDGVPITITLGGNVVTGTTFVHPGHTTPTFGIDISSLSPDFLKPVTLTAAVSGTTVQRQVLVFPDFATQSQQYDLYAMAVTALDPAPVWGHVVDFGAGGPVVSATITAEHDGVSITVTSTAHPLTSLPAYGLSAADLMAIGAGPGSTVTLTARYGGDVDRRVVTLGAESQQVSFSTGWMCDGFDPLPRSWGGAALPRSWGGAALPRSWGGAALPDVVCFWGYGAVNGTPTAGVAVQLVVNGATYEGQTQYHLGETVPRYAIGVWGGQVISGQMLVATGVYSGYAASTAVTVTPDADLSQRVDLSIKAGTDALANLTSVQYVGPAVRHSGYLWIGTTGGVVRLDPSDGSTVQFTTVDGLAHNDVGVAVVDSEGFLWFGTDAGASRYSPATGEWKTFFDSPYQGISAIALAPDDSLWFIASSDLVRYAPGTGVWTSQPVTDGLPVDCVYDMVIDSQGVLWLATYDGVWRYTPGIDRWDVFTTTAGLVSDEVNAIAIGSDDSLWSATRAGVSHYTPSSDTWETFTTTHGLIANTVDAVAVGQDGSLWFGSTWGSGVSHYTPISDTWETLTTADGMLGDQVMDIVADADGSIWFIAFGCDVSRYAPAEGVWTTYTVATELADNAIGAIAFDAGGLAWIGTSRGVSRYDPATGEWATFTTLDGLANSVVRDIAIAADGSVWLGTSGGVSHYTPLSDTWETFTAAAGLPDDGVNAIAIVPDGSLWFGTDGGMSHYTPTTGLWTAYTTTVGLADNAIRAVAVGSDDSLWFGMAGGVSHYTPISGTWETLTTTHGLVDDDVRAIALAPDGSLWFGTNGGVSHYTPTTSGWETVTTLDGLSGSYVRGVAVSADGSVWFGTLGAGGSHYTPNGNPEWDTFTADDGLASNRVSAVAIAPDGSVWFGTDSGVSHWTYAPPKSDLALQVSGPAAALPGQSITYTLHLSNHGQASAVNTVLTLALPVSATYLSASRAPSGTAPLAWSLSAVSITHTVSFVVTATVDAAVLPGVTLVATATAFTTSDEVFLFDNAAQASIAVRDPDRADARVTLSAPPVLVPSAQAAYSIWVDNAGGLDAQDTALVVTLPADLSYQEALPSPSGVGSDITWDLDTLPALGAPTSIALTVTVAGTVPAETDLSVLGIVTTTSPDADPLNNTAVVTASTSLTDALTLILVAPDRLAACYGASPLLSDLHLLADHPRVGGVVLDVTVDPDVRTAYAAWDAAPHDWASANAVAQAIKALIDRYTVDYPNLRYLVVVGSDDVIPFYRVRDQNPMMWRESRYGYQTPPGTVRAALAADTFLTDDFYADRAPTVPDSPFWGDSRAFYLPDFAIGRLVETPEEIAAVIDAFIAGGGTIPLDPSLVGSIGSLTGDLGQAQCAAMGTDGLTTMCTTDLLALRQTFLEQDTGSVWAAVHGNHFSLGALYTTDILNRTLPLSDTLLVATSCHTGLNVPASSGLQPDADLPQALAARGGTVVAPTAYAYASSIGTGYSEALALELTQQLLADQAQEIGPALVQAKRDYYTDHAGWFDATDEKVLSSVTLYGLPMLEVSMPGGLPDAAQDTSPAHLEVARSGSTEVVTHTFSGLTFSQHTTSDGVYYDYNGQIIAQEGLPVQPALQSSLDALPSGHTARGVLLRLASYAEHAGFDPVIAQSWAIGEERSVMAEPPVTLAGWDRDLPYALARFEGLTATVASLNLVPGIYDADRQAEYLFDGMTLEVLYGDGGDAAAPEIQSAYGEIDGGRVVFQVSASDDIGVTQVVVVYDAGQGHWHSLPLVTSDGETWTGEVVQSVARFYVQAADAGGNVGTNTWGLPTRIVYFPIAFCAGQ